MRARVQGARPPFALIVIFAALVAGIVAGARFYYVRQRQAVLEAHTLLVQGTTRLQAARLRSWVADRSRDAHTLAASCSRLSAGSLRASRAEPRLGRQAAAWVEALASGMPVRAMHILDAGGDVVIHYERRPCRDEAAARATARQATDLATTAIRGIVRDEDGLHVYIAAPIKAPVGGPSERLGAVVLDMDAAEALMAPASEWFGPTRSWETLLLHSQEATLAVLSAPGPAPRIPRFGPAPADDAILAHAFAGRVGHLYGACANGQPAIAQIEPIPEANWILVGRDALDEVDRMLRPFAVPWVLAVLLLVAFAFGALYGLWQVSVARQVRRAYTAEKELNVSRSLLQTVIDTVPQLLFWKDRESRYLGCNLPFAGAAGLKTQDEVRGLRDEQLAWPAQAEEFQRSDREVMQAGEARLGYEEPLYAANGARRWMRTSKVPLRDDTGEVYGVLGTSEDITALVESRQALEEARADLERKNQELSNLLFVTSHDLRRPLVTIHGFAAELQRSVDDLLSLLRGVDVPPERAERLREIAEGEVPAAAKYIADGVRALDRMLRGILDISRLDRAGFDMQTVDMQQLVADIVTGMGPEIDQAGASVIVGALPPCHGDPVRLGQVITNLLSNAVKYLDPGRPGELRISGETVDTKVVYCIQDNGIGIEADKRDRVFDMFYRAAPGHAEGEGLGLASVRAIVGRHGGRCWVESEPGQGSRFYVSLPRPGGRATPQRQEGR